MSVHYKLTAKDKRTITQMSNEDLLERERKWRSPYESAYYDAIVAEIKRRKEISK